MRKLVVVVAVVAASLIGVSAASAAISQWTGVAFSPQCAGGIVRQAQCYGGGQFESDTGTAAWSQMEVCGSQLLTGGWQNYACEWWPGAPNFTDIQVGESGQFFLSVCNRWYSTYVFAKVLLTGGWQTGFTRAPGVKVRCAAGASS